MCLALLEGPLSTCGFSWLDTCLAALPGQLPCAGAGAAPPGHCSCPNTHCDLSSQEEASPRGAVGDNAPRCATYTTGWDGASQEAMFPCMFPREPQIFAESISHKRGTLTLHDLLFNHF